MGYLLGDQAKPFDEFVQPDTFAKEVLGFEEIQDEEEENTQDQLAYADQEEGSFPAGITEEKEEEPMPDSQLKEQPSVGHEDSGQ